jgi:hypothetical protein
LNDETRAIAIRLPSREELQEHQVHERAYLLVADGEIVAGVAAAGIESTASLMYIAKG